jgi:hypothetical protein
MAQVEGSGVPGVVTSMLANDWATSIEPVTPRSPVKSTAMALVVIPADSLVSGICWYRTTVKPGILIKSVLAGGATRTV